MKTSEAGRPHAKHISIPLHVVLEKGIGTSSQNPSHHVREIWEVQARRRSLPRKMIIIMMKIMWNKLSEFLVFGGFVFFCFHVLLSWR